MHMRKSIAKAAADKPLSNKGAQKMDSWGVSGSFFAPADGVYFLQPARAHSISLPCCCVTACSGSFRVRVGVSVSVRVTVRICASEVIRHAGAI